MENPVFINELRQSPFRRKSYQFVLLWIGISALILFVGDYIDPATMLFWLPLILLTITVPSFAAGLFAKEYEQQTWQDLTLTRLTNAQVVLGKFFSALLHVGLIFLMALPPLFYKTIQGSYRYRLDIQPWYFADYVFKLLLSSSLYIMLAMVCSRYCSNRRTALIWCYIALFLYGLFGALVWSVIGSTLDPRYLSNPFSSNFMQGIHLIFCAVVGLGGLILLWVSLSEQRGYKRTDDGMSRGWQPIAKKLDLEKGLQK